MPAAPLPANEPARLAALHSYDLLDSAPDADLDRLTRLAARLTGSPSAMISLVDAERQWFKSRHGMPLEETPRDQAFCAYAILTPAEPLLVDDASCDPRFADNPLVTGAPGLRSYAGLPLVTEAGHALGTLCVASPTPGKLGPDTLETLSVLAQAVMTALELRRAVQLMRTLALTDALTGLPNRPALLAAIARAIARQQRDRAPFSMLYVDLDGFKKVNDSQGHAAGDRALVRFAELLRAGLRAVDTPSRVGGDEFAAVLDGTAGAAEAIAERLRQATEQAMRAEGWPITASIGLASFTDPPADPAAALSEADRRMYAAKSTGKNRVAAGAH